MAEVEGDAHAGAARQLVARRPADFSHLRVEHAAHAHATSAPCGVSLAGSARRSRRNWSRSFPAAAANSSMKLCVAKAMPLLLQVHAGSRGRVLLHQRRVERKVRNEARRELTAADSCAGTERRGRTGRVWRGGSGGGGELLGVAERDEVILPRDDLSTGVHRAGEVVEAGGAIEVVVHVVFARPQQLHGRRASPSRCAPPRRRSRS